MGWQSRVPGVERWGARGTAGPWEQGHKQQNFAGPPPGRGGGVKVSLHSCFASRHLCSFLMLQVHTRAQTPGCTIQGPAS